MANEILAKYRCSQTELYAISTLGWTMCKNAQGVIVAAYPEYTVPYIDAKLADIVTTQQLPDFQARNLITETDHILLGQLASAAIANWDFLERYIIRSFQTNKPLIKPNVEAAGKPYYAAATDENPNWEDLKQMLINGNTYLTDHAATTLAGIMPVGFDVTYAASKTAFENKYNTFTTGEVAAPGDTSAKITANNTLHTDLMLMLGDLLTVTPPATKNQISFTYLKGIISAPGPAGLKGTLTDSVTGNPVSGVLLRLTPTANETTTGPDGKYDFGNIPSGPYDLQISLDNYQTLTPHITIHTGVTSTHNYTLVPAPAITIIREGDVPPLAIVNINVDGIKGISFTSLLIEITGSPLKFYAAVNTTDAPGTEFYQAAVGNAPFVPDEFAIATGFGPSKPFLNVQNTGAVAAHYKLTFSNPAP